MKTKLTKLLLLAIVVSVRSVASAEDSLNQPALIAAMEEVEKALRSRDETTLRKRLAEDFVMVHTTGAARDTRDRFIHSLINYGRHGRDVRTTTYDREIRLLSSGLVLVLSTVEERAGDKSRWLTHTSIWRDKSGYWQVIYGHQAFVNRGAGDRVVERVPLTTIDRLVTEYHLPRVTLIKMDIKGATVKALDGARMTIQKYHPRLAISTEEKADEPHVVRAKVQGIAQYSERCGLCSVTRKYMVNPDVLLFRYDEPSKFPVVGSLVEAAHSPYECS